MKYIKLIPNMLTFSRIGITVLLNIMIITGMGHGFTQIIVVTGLTSVLFATDFLDGKLARIWNCSSKFGARIDIVADFFYIISQDIILVYYGRMSKWILVLILMEFAIFIVSSLKVIKITGIQQIWFDRIGRITAVYYYAMPFTYWIIGDTNLVLIADFVCIILTAAAIGSRLTAIVDTISISREEM